MLGKLSATRVRRPNQGSIRSTRCPGSSLTPRLPAEPSNAPASASRRARGTRMLPSCGKASSSASARQLSATNRPALSSGIELLLERLLAGAAVDLDKRLLLAPAQLEIGLDDTLDRVRHLFGREAGADDLADRRLVVGAAAQRDLVEFLALLVEAEDADMPDMVMAAGVDAARDLDLQVADGALAFQGREPRADRLRDRDRTRGGQRAIIHARAGDDVGDQVVVGGRQPGLIQQAPQREQIALPDIGQDQVLLVRHPDLAMAELVGQGRHRAHLHRGRVTRDAAYGLERDVDDGIAVHLVARRVLAHPAGEFW